MHIPALLSALLLPSGMLSLVVYLAFELAREHFDIEKHQDLDSEYIQSEWEFRNQYRYFATIAAFVTCAGWIFFCITLLEFAWIASKRGKKSIALHLGIAFVAIAGTFTEGLAIMLYLGSTSASKFITENLNLDHWLGPDSEDGIGWKANELVHIVSQGMLIFVDSFEFICIFFIMILLHVSVRRWRLTDTTSFGVCWNALGLFIGLLSLLDYLAAVLRLKGFQLFGVIALGYTLINRVILLPIWIIMFARRLPNARMKLDAPAEMPQDLMEQVTT